MSDEWFDFESLDERAEDSKDGWQAMCAILAEDENWARHLFETSPHWE